jgi:hypothetical protein
MSFAASRTDLRESPQRYLLSAKGSLYLSIGGSVYLSVIGNGSHARFGFHSSGQWTLAACHLGMVIEK